MRHKIKKLEKAEEELIGRVAFLTDEAILAFVVENPKEKDLYSIHQMEKALLKKRHYEDVFTDEERPIYVKRWDNLKERVGWRNGHYRALTALKQMHVESAPLNVDVANLEKAIDQACIGEALKSQCKDLIRIFNVVQGLPEPTSMQH